MTCCGYGVHACVHVCIGIGMGSAHLHVSSCAFRMHKPFVDDMLVILVMCLGGLPQTKCIPKGGPWGISVAAACRSPDFYPVKTSLTRYDLLCTKARPWVSCIAAADISPGSPSQIFDQLQSTIEGMTLGMAIGLT